MAQNLALPRFDNTKRHFYTELKKRVDAYFRENKIHKTGNWKLHVKTAFMFCIYFTPYILVCMNVISSNTILFLLAMLMGLAMAGIGLCVMHDANHGSYSKNARLNKFIGFFSMNVIGGYSTNWQVQHNVIHHTYTNVHEHDEDITPRGILRFEPHSKKLAIHRLQFIYAWFFYGLMTIMWATSKDFIQIVRYNRRGLLKTMNTNIRKELGLLIISKIGYLAFLALPLFVNPDLSLTQWLVGIAVMSFTSSLSLAAIFQSAHVVTEASFPVPDENGNLESHWAEHQLRTTMNFATKDPVFSWLVGGLNYQVEHHLFPNICHVHYPKISHIVRTTAEEYNIPYHSRETFVDALWSHQQMLWRLGRA